MSAWDVRWDTPIGAGGAQRKTSLITHPRYGNFAPWSWSVGSRFSVAKNSSTSACALFWMEGYIIMTKKKVVSEDTVYCSDEHETTRERGQRYPQYLRRLRRARPQPT